MLKKRHDLFTYNQLANRLRTESKTPLKLFAYVAVDVNDVTNVKIYAEEDNVMRFLEYMNQGVFREAFNQAFMNGPGFKKAD